MKHQLLTLIASMVAAAALAPAPVAAQNMNQMIQNQMRMQRIGDQMARAAAMNYYNYARALRQQGYTGPIPTGVTTQSLADSNSRLQSAYDRYNAGSAINSRITHDAITSTSNAITRGCASKPVWGEGQMSLLPSLGLYLFTNERGWPRISATPGNENTPLRHDSSFNYLRVFTEERKGMAADFGHPRK